MATFKKGDKVWHIHQAVIMEVVEDSEELVKCKSNGVITTFPGEELALIHRPTMTIDMIKTGQEIRDVNIYTSPDGHGNDECNGWGIVYIHDERYWIISNKNIVYSANKDSDTTFNFYYNEGQVGNAKLQ